MKQQMKVRHSHRNRLRATAIMGLLVSAGFYSIVSRAEESVKLNSETGSTSILQQMSRESQQLYQNTSRGIVRLQLPTPKWLNEIAARDNPVDRWKEQLTGPMKSQLESERDQVKQGVYSALKIRVVSSRTESSNASGDLSKEKTPSSKSSLTSESSATTRQTIIIHGSNSQVHTLPGGWNGQQQPVDGSIVLQPDPAGPPKAIEIQTGGVVVNGVISSDKHPQLSLQAVGSFVPNNAGLIISEQRHVLVPIFLEKETVGSGVRASIGNGLVITATFVASDKPSNITILQLPKLENIPVEITPVKLSSDRPNAGALVMLISPRDLTSRLMQWHNAQQDSAGIIVNLDGSICGFQRYGQFLSAGLCKPAIEQLITTGKVNRPRLGMVVREVNMSDMARETIPALGDKPALIVDEVEIGSLAEESSIRRGDLILKVADIPVGDPSTLAAVLANRSGVTKFDLVRNGKALSCTAELKLK